MKFAVGTADTIRMFIETTNISGAVAQCREGEHAWEVVDVPAVVFEENPRLRRNQLLTDSDWTQMPDNALSDSVKGQWASYRQALRDVDFDAPIWPEITDFVS